MVGFVGLAASILLSRPIGERRDRYSLINEGCFAISLLSSITRYLNDINGFAPADRFTAASPHLQPVRRPNPRLNSSLPVGSDVHFTISSRRNCPLTHRHHRESASLTGLGTLARNQKG